MTTRYRWFHFLASGPQWLCYTNSDAHDLLGHCRFYQRWHQWEFCPEPGTGFTHDCLQDLAHFLSQLCKPPSK